MAYTPLDSANTIFNKISYISLHEQPKDSNGLPDITSTTGYQEFTGNGQLIPAVVNDTVDFVGDDPTTDTVTSIDGSTIIERTTEAGTFVVEFNTANIGPGALGALLGASGAASVTSSSGGSVLPVAGTSTKIPRTRTFRTGVNFIDSTRATSLFAPDCQVMVNTSYEDDLLVISVRVTVLGVTTNTLSDLNLIQLTSGTFFDSSIIGPSSAASLPDVQMPSIASTAKNANTSKVTL